MSLSDEGARPCRHLKMCFKLKLLIKLSKLNITFLQDVTTVQTSMFVIFNVWLYSDMMGCIVVCEDCSQVVMQYDRCRIPSHACRAGLC